MYFLEFHLTECVIVKIKLLSLFMKTLAYLNAHKILMFINIKMDLIHVLNAVKVLI